MTLEDLSKRIGFSISYLSEIENAEKSPPERNIVLSMEKILNAKGKLLLSSFISNEHVTFVQSSMDLLNKKKLYEIYKSGK
jgi:transcriptional regulator with XRE-family HTH domain